MEKIIDEIEKIKRVEYARGYQDGLLAQKHFEEQFEKVAKAVAEETAQEKRDRIVQRAKEDIKNLESNGKNNGEDHEKGNSVYHHAFYDVVFHVNRTKRTVVEVVKGVFTGKIFAKGIAKCAPSDCFNEHIGKAIALRRALGLKVPKDYLDAPNPTEVRVGNVVKLKSVPFGIPYTRTVEELLEERVEYTNGGFDSIGHMYASGKIIDDSVSIKEGTEC